MLNIKQKKDVVNIFSKRYGLHKRYDLHTIFGNT